jgi:flagellar motor switch protein FliN/FliY
MSVKLKNAKADEAAQATQEIKLQELKQEAPGNTLYNGNLGLIQNLKVKLEVMVGGCEISIGELYALAENSVLTLDRATDAPLDIYLDGKQIGSGKLVVVDDNFGICITAIASGQQS